jgi:hypothetical protein
MQRPVYARDVRLIVSEEAMTKSILAACAAAFLAVSIAQPAVAEDKKVTPQQQKMKECAAKWKDEKAAKHVSGQAEYRKFMSACLKR